MHQMMKQKIFEITAYFLILLRRIKRRAAGIAPSNAVVNKDVSEEDKRAYSEIMKLVPEAGMHKASTILHIRDLAGEAGYGSLDEYLCFLKENPDERIRLKDNLTLKGTHFFRGNDWKEFESILAGHLTGKKEIRVWCAGCSDGKEVYSVIMLLMDHFAPGNIAVIASDIDGNMTRSCREGRYPMWQLEEVPGKYWKYARFDASGAGTGSGKRKILSRFSFSFVPEIKNMTEVCRHDLLKDPYPRGFDIILCRNVIKFFSPDTIKAVQGKLAESLNEGGILFLSRDGEGNDKELISDPGRLGLIKPGEAPVYVKAV